MTGQTGGGQARLTRCGAAPAAKSTRNEWSPAERFVSGSAPRDQTIPGATRPSVDVQSVPRFARRFDSRERKKYRHQKGRKLFDRRLTNWEVPVAKLDATIDEMQRQAAETLALYTGWADGTSN